MSEVFVSYSHEDVDTVRKLSDHIAAHGLVPWWDRDLLPGRDFDREIENAIDNASTVVVVWSKNSVDSRWVRAEASEALDQGKLLPVQIDACRIPMEFRRIQTAQLLEWDGMHSHPELAKVMTGLKSLLRSQSGAAIPPQKDDWTIASKDFKWSGASVRLQRGKTQRSIAYQNHLNYEAIYVDGSEICRGGDERLRHPQFEFYIEDERTPYHVRVEPVYGMIGQIFGRLGGLKITNNGAELLNIKR